MTAETTTLVRSAPRLPAPLARAALLARTVSHLHPAQLLFRPLHVVRTALLSRAPPLARLLAGPAQADLGPPLLLLRGNLPAQAPGIAGELALARAALEGAVTLAGHVVAVDPPTSDFALCDLPKLVRYQRGYLAPVRALAVAARTEGFESRAAAARLACAHLREFLDTRPPGADDAWEPYVVAIRLLNLLVARELLRPVAAPDDAAFLDGRVVGALAQHARWLAGTLELHLLGNHLFTNGAALYVAGCALQAPAAPAWRALGHAIVARSLVTDVLADGGHVERSPMYGALYLDQLLLAMAAARALSVEPPAGARHVAERMAQHLAVVAHPDGDPALLGDTALDEAPRADDLGGPFELVSDSLRRRLYGSFGSAGPAPTAPRSGARAWLFSKTGVAAVREGEHFLVVDAGPLGSDDQPGHAHADALTFELSHAGRRVVVDGGAGHYESDAVRAYFRGPFAHNAVSVGGQGPDELWGAFRAGDRGVVSGLAYQRGGALHVVRGEVRAAAGWRHERLFIYAPGAILLLADRVTGAPDTAIVRSHLLLAPEFSPVISGASETAIDGVGRLVRLVGRGWAAHRGEAEPFRGWTSARFGRFDAATEVATEPERWSWGRVAMSALVFDPAARVEAIPHESGRGAGARVTLGADVVTVTVTADAAGLRWEQPPAGR
jgi:hypothetical protein